MEMKYGRATVILPLHKLHVKAAAIWSSDLRLCRIHPLSFSKMASHPMSSFPEACKVRAPWLFNQILPLSDYLEHKSSARWIMLFVGCSKSFNILNNWLDHLHGGRGVQTAANTHKKKKTLTQKHSNHKRVGKNAAKKKPAIKKKKQGAAKYKRSEDT